MKKLFMASALLAALILALSLPVGAKPPGGVPPGQAKKMGDSEASVGVSVGGVTVTNQAQGKGGPPPWAPAHGRRAKYQYRYWPAAQVYFDAGRGFYFWFSGGSWRMGASLPGGISIAGSYVKLDMDAAKPYQWHKDVLKAYPPVTVK